MMMLIILALVLITGRSAEVSGAQFPWPDFGVTAGMVKAAYSF